MRVIRIDAIYHDRAAALVGHSGPQGRRPDRVLPAIAVNQVLDAAHA